MEEKISPATVRIGDSSSLDKKRIPNTSAGCYLVRKREEVIELLIIKKVWSDGTTKYVLPKGHREGGESLEEAALREVMEESGYVDITLLKYLGSATYELDWEDMQMKTDHYYLALLNSEKQEGKEQMEGLVVENMWMELEESFPLLTFEKYEQIHELVREYVKDNIQ